MTPEHLITYMKEDGIDMKPPFLSDGDNNNNYLVMEPNAGNVRFPNLRFQCCWARYEVDKLSESRDKKNYNKVCLLYGFIGVSDYHVSQQQHGWLPLDQPDYGYTLLFDREWHDPLPVKNNYFIPSLINPATNQSVSLGSSFLNIIVDMCAFDKENNQCFRVACSNLVYNLSEPKSLNSFFTNTFRGIDGHLDLSFIVLTDAVDAHIEITFKTTQPDSFISGKPVHVKIIGYYGDDFVSTPAPTVQKTRRGRTPIKPIENAHYCVTLFESDSVSLCDCKNLQLDNSVMAVPAKGSLVVDAYIVDFASHKSFMDHRFRIPAKQQGNNFQCIEGNGCRFEVKVIWNKS